MTLDEFITRLQTLDARADAISIRLLSDAGDDVLVIAQDTGHRLTGRMDDTMHRIGPYPVGSDTQEARIESGMPYAIYEVARGGDHDWPVLTDQKAEPRMQALANAVADSVVRALTERS